MPLAIIVLGAGAMLVSVALEDLGARADPVLIIAAYAAALLIACARWPESAQKKTPRR